MATFTSQLLLLSCAVYLSLACEPGPQVCPSIHSPVCATLHMTFPNECVMKAQLCDLAKDGFHFWEKHQGDCCDGPIPLLASPTCGSDGKVYGNWWDLSYSACRNKDYITETSPDNCPDFPENAMPAPVS